MNLQFYAIRGILGTIKYIESEDIGMKTLYIECNMGAAGDMLMAALLELVEDQDAFLKQMNDLNIPGVVIAKEQSIKCGITGTHMNISINHQEEESMDYHHETHDHHPEAHDHHPETHDHHPEAHDHHPETHYNNPESQYHHHNTPAQNPEVQDNTHDHHPNCVKELNDINR